MYLTMTEKRKIKILQLTFANKIKISEAAFLLKRSERTVYRLCAQLSQSGLSAVLHFGNNGTENAVKTFNDVFCSVAPKTPPPKA